MPQVQQVYHCCVDLPTLTSTLLLYHTLSAVLTPAHGPAVDQCRLVLLYDCRLLDAPRLGRLSHCPILSAVLCRPREFSDAVLFTLLLRFKVQYTNMPLRMAST